MPGKQFHIVFYPGTHGNFLCWILNKCLLGDQFAIDNPLNDIGTSHHRLWEIDWSIFSDKMHFRCWHQWEIQHLANNDKFITIDFGPEDDIFVLQLLLKRAYVSSLDVDDICRNTYHKLYENSTPQVNQIIDHVNRYRDISPYHNIKNDDWPTISTVDDFDRLPKAIRDEAQARGFHPVDLKASRPDCPRWVMRSIFKNWFITGNLPSAEMQFLISFPDTYRFDLFSFYDYIAMKDQIYNIGRFFSLDLDLAYFPQSLHDQFLSHIPFLNTKKECHQILQAIKSEHDIPIKLNVFCEGYLDYLIETFFLIEMPLHHETYFDSTAQIVDFIKHHDHRGEILRDQRT